MARSYSKRVYSRKYWKGRRYYRRRYRRLRRRYRKRRYAARRRNRAEVKQVSKEWRWWWDFTKIQNDLNAPGTYPANCYCYHPGRCVAFPSPASNNFAMNIPKGINGDERIGSKLTPVKLLISGTFTWSPPNTIVSSQLGVNYLTEPIVGQSYAIRCIVFQAIAGNDKTSPGQYSYNPSCPMISTNLSSQYLVDHQDDTGCNVSWDELTKIYSTVFWSDGGNKFTATQSDLYANMAFTKIPLRTGITKYIKILKNKVMYVNSFRSAKIFKFKTKIPRVLVWPEDVTGSMDNDRVSNVPNGIFVLWTVVPLTQRLFGKVDLTCQVNFSYTDA